MQIKNFTGLKALLFNNISVKQTVFKNTFWLGVASGVNKLLKFILFIYVARILGATEYGKFTFALSFVGLFVIFSDLGLSQIVTKELAREKEKEREFSAIISLKIILSIATLILILIGSFFITSDLNIQKVIWVLAVFILIESFSGIIFSFLQARQKMEYQSLASMIEALLATGAGIFMLFYFPSVQNLSYIYLFAALIVLISILFYFHFKIQKLSLSWDKPIWQRFLLMSWPLAVAGMASSICNQTDSIMLGYFKQITQTGWYNAAYRIVAVALIPMGLVGASIFPALSKSFGESKEKLQGVWNYFMELMIFFAIPLIIGGIVLAPKIIEFIYESSYLPSVLAFQILIIMVGIVFLYNPFYQILIISNQQKKLFLAVLAGALINVILNWILIPRFSLYGAAVATVISQVLIFFLSLKFTVELTPVKPLNFKLMLSFISALLSGFAMYFVISNNRIYHLHVLFPVLIGTLVYFATFFVSRYAIGTFSRTYEKT
jgi:O-antigen/teichoic acid export membrane protein